MTHVQQPRRSSLCGQCCVAMIASVDVERAIAVCTFKRRRATSEVDLRGGLRTLGFKLTDFDRWSTQRVSSGHALLYRVPLVLHEREPATSLLCRVRYEGFASYHWIVIDNRTIHDPAFAAPSDAYPYERLMRQRKAYITSYARVQPS